jgi:hypothetical protein
MSSQCLQAGCWTLDHASEVVEDLVHAVALLLQVQREPMLVGLVPDLIQGSAELQQRHCILLDMASLIRIHRLLKN